MFVPAKAGAFLNKTSGLLQACLWLPKEVFMIVKKQKFQNYKIKSYNIKKSEGSRFHWFAETYIAGFQGATFLVAHTPKKLPSATKHLNWLHLIKRMYRNIS